MVAKDFLTAPHERAGKRQGERTRPDRRAKMIDTHVRFYERASARGMKLYPTA